MQRTKIEWVRNPDGSKGYSWNPIKGLCPVRCRLPNGKIYCYAHRNYRRFKWNPEIMLNPFEVNEPYLLKKPATIFICSTIELFHPDIPKLWRDCVFVTIETNPQHTFIVLTKLPENIERAMPDNVWLGVSITKQEDLCRIESLREAQAKIKFISFEPLLEKIQLTVNQGYFSNILESIINWIIIGRLTGFGHKYDPKLTWIEHIKYCADVRNIPIFMKDNLKGIWPGRLIQEFPRDK